MPLLTSIAPRMHKRRPAVDQEFTHAAREPRLPVTGAAETRVRCSGLVGG